MSRSANLTSRSLDVTRSLKVWLSAFRLRTLPLATASIMLGSFLAAADDAFRWQVALLCFATAILLQILSNLANDYGDTVHGADSSARVGPKRATQSGQISKAAMRRALWLFVGLSLGVGYLLVRGESIFYYLLGLAAIAAAIAYTAGPRPYGYAGLGDLFVLVFFGMVGVLGTYYLHTHRLDWTVLLPALSCGFFCVAVLNINNLRDLESDRRAGKYTIPVRLGGRRARLYHWFLLLTGLACATAYAVLNFRSPVQFLFLASVPLLLENGRRVWQQRDAAELDPQLRQMALTTLLFSLTFGLGSVL
ncbi:MAG: 1,4-dihydroxy-2-naphthoate polyprenyltransferase [Calditrichaeota bacterium]|nr:MAG: 1,4-dihydroxy-2-naphthoate polyprenyltransferase [Calditrichota bacterium]